jgi:FkbM family methyltransferase
MSIIDKILSLPELIENPPVLVDIGASGSIHKEWKKFAKYAVCLAFDADEREFGYISDESKGFKKLFIYNSLVSSNNGDTTDFFLTNSPYCSSTLEPDVNALKDWAFASKFEISKKVTVKNTTLTKVLLDVGIQKIDWLKTDTQGIDLSIFSSLPVEIQKKALIVELEPGIIDSYKGEDKLYKVFEYFDGLPFWLGAMTVKGSQRLREDDVEGLHLPEGLKKFLYYSHKSSPGWAELKYFNDFSEELSLRDHLLGWVFAILEKQFGYALTIALHGRE